MYFDAGVELVHTDDEFTNRASRGAISGAATAAPYSEIGRNSKLKDCARVGLLPSFPTINLVPHHWIFYFFLRGRQRLVTPLRLQVSMGGDDTLVAHLLVCLSNIE
ncbi:hypothetical protein EVAR_100013_1 [Eumeta japonica]|uniref:Uncharacterized protein n=1 Tax=Eumeta variegata TaxID=151549 RepID=A0A4C1ZRH1_EUMVA|nr:hypothetical protein EVAR_100013_1 [Eumeta japonica]